MTKPLQEIAYEKLSKSIKENKFQIGEIYSITKIAKEMKISRTPFKDALSRLEQDGYVKIIPSKGFKLYEITSKDLIEINQIRKAIEGFCAIEIISDSPNKPTEKKLVDNLMKQQNLILDKKFDIKKFLEYDMEFHKIIVESSNNDTLLKIFNSYYYQITTLAMDSLSEWHRPKDAIREHKKIVDAIIGKDKNECREAIYMHMDASLKINFKQLQELEDKVEN